MVCAHCSKASLLVPKPKLRAKVRKKACSQSPLLWVSWAWMRCVFCSKRSVCRLESSCGAGVGQARDEAVAGRVMAGFNQLAVVV